MATFGLEVDNCKVAYDYVRVTAARLQDKSSLIKNPFVDSSMTIHKKAGVDKVMIVSLMSNIYPDFSLAGFFFPFIVLVGAPVWMLLFSIPFILVWFVHSKYLYVLGLKRGMRKAGYQGKFRVLKTDEIIRRLV